MLKIETPSTPTIQRDAYARQATHAQQSRTLRLTRHDPGPRDSVQLSTAAEAAAAEEPRLRQALVERIRGEIEAGRYLTDEKVEIAAEQLHRELRTGRS